MGDGRQPLRAIVPFTDVRIEPRPGAVAVTGRTELPDGTILRTGLWRGSYEGPFDHITYTTTTVRDGQFVAEFTAPSWTGETTASVELRADHEQPDAVRAVIGPTGEKVAFADTIGRTYRQFFVTYTTSLGNSEPT